MTCTIKKNHCPFFVSRHTINIIKRKMAVLLSWLQNCNLFSRMNPISTVRKATFLCVLLCATLSVISQVQYPVPIEEKVLHSPLIAEGRVIVQESFWTPQHTMIFTSNKVEVYKLFKGTTLKDTIEVMTQGGSVGNQSISVSELLTLRRDDIGVFFCFPNELRLTNPRSGNLLYDVYGSAQGMLKYDLKTQTANAPFARFNRIE